MIKEVIHKIGAMMGIGETSCGVGSYRQNTLVTRDFIENVFKYYSIKSIIDIGSGDWNWMKDLAIEDRTYVGYDKDEGFVNSCNNLYGEMPTRRFIQYNILLSSNHWPKSDLIICRDLLIHLTNETIIRLLKEFKASESTWLITTTYPNCKDNVQLSGEEASYTNKSRPSRVVNLMTTPYHLPMPYACVKEHPIAIHKGRMIGLWKLNEIVELV